MEEQKDRQKGQKQYAPNYSIHGYENYCYIYLKSEIEAGFIVHCICPI